MNKSELRSRCSHFSDESCNYRKDIYDTCLGDLIAETTPPSPCLLDGGNTATRKLIVGCRGALDVC